MTDEDRKRAAQVILDIPFFNALWDEIEQAAINACIHAKYDDHEARQAYAAEARAIKEVRRRLESLAKDQSVVARRAPA